MGWHDAKGDLAFQVLLSLFGLVEFVHWITTVCASLGTGKETASSEDSHPNIPALLPMVGKGLMVFLSVV